MDKEPFFSIIVPIYKVEKYLNQCIDSVINQTYTNFELILVDDGSQDNCPKICDEYALKDSRIKVIHKQNGGLSSARNAGLYIASGEYVLFLDSDDYWYRDTFLSKAYDKLKDGKFDIIIFGMIKYYQQDNSYGNKRVPCIVDEAKKEDLYKLQNTNTFVTGACDKIYKKEFIDDNNLKFVQGQLSEDMEWCAKILLAYPIVSIMEDVYYVYRQQSTSISHNVGTKHLQDICDFIVKYSDIGKENDNNTLLNYVANQYVLWLTISTLVDDDISCMLKNMKKYWFLLKFNIYPYVNKVSKLKWLGFDAIRVLLKTYKKYIAKK